jgi:lipopolysaccharide transport system ATP-binding protein
VQLHIAVNPVAEKCSNLILAAGITTLQGEGVLHLSTETGGLPLPSLDTATVLTCTIPRLTLRGGYYSINLFLSANGIVTDWLQGGYRFQIEDADFYRTGKLPPEGYSTFLADFSWAIAKE